MQRSHRDFLATHETAIPAADARLSVFIREYRRFRDATSKPLRLLDIGCGKRPVLARYVDARDEYWGCDFYESAEVDVPNYVQADLNEETVLRKLEAPFDVIFCGEVLEHLFSPDALAADLGELLASEGILIVSTPNLAYYVNRILLLVGISPLFLENSAEVKLGRRTRRLGQGNRTEGHIRLFTYRALREFFARHDFEIVRVVPTLTWNFALDRFVCRFSRSLAPNNVFVVRKGAHPGHADGAPPGPSDRPTR